MKNKILLAVLLVLILMGCKEQNTPTSYGNGGNNNYDFTETIADFTYEVTPSDARRIKFINKSSSDLYNFSWDFGDGFTSDEKNPEKLYWKNGDYVVKLTAWGSNSQQKYVCEKTINVNSDEPGLFSTIYVKGFKLYAIPSDGRYYKFSLIGSSSWNDEANITVNTAYTDKLYISDLPRTFMLTEPADLCSYLDLSVGYYDDLFVYVYQATSKSQSGTQCLKQTIYHGSDYSDIDSGETFQFRDEYIVSSDNGQTRVGVLMGWSDK